MSKPYYKKMKADADYARFLLEKRLSKKGLDDGTKAKIKRASAAALEFSAALDDISEISKR